MDALKWVPLAIVLSACVHQSAQKEFHCDAETFLIPAREISGATVDFNEHIGTKKFESYLSLDLKYQDFASVFAELQKKFGPLKSRGEAHVTVITPPEYDEILSSHISMREINALAVQSNIQAFKLTPVCVGRGEAKINAQPEATYFVVLMSQDLIDFRRLVLKEFVARGGAASAFKPENFYPHITLGFSLRDLHESDGVKKDKKTCIANVQLQK